MAKKLSRKELFSLYNSKWLDKDDKFKRELFILLYKDKLEKKVIPTSIVREHTELYNFDKAKVLEYTIGNGEIIELHHFDGYKSLKIINIQYDFNIDDDCYTRFGRFTPNLEIFRVLNKRSPFFEVDGVLYLDIEKARKGVARRETINYYLENCEIPNSLNGKMLIAMPPKYKSQSFEIPDFVEVIGCSAFCGSNLESLSIPRSVKYIGMGGLGEMKYLKELKVPNQPICIWWDYNYIGHKLNITCSQKGIELGQELQSFWHGLLEENVFDKQVIKPILEELKINDEDGVDLFSDSIDEIPF
ncbi:MAG: leucine-rich repeat protein [Prevotella sp.]|nr:leucine-rich repeat protein [Prevotella sp.]